jgi:hypothetical protein
MANYKSAIFWMAARAQWLAGLKMMFKADSNRDGQDRRDLLIYSFTHLLIESMNQ